MITPKSVARVLGAAGTAILLALGGASAAVAASSSSSVTNLSIEKLGSPGEALTQHDTVKFSGNWAVTDPKAGDSFTVGMPAELSFQSEMDFPLEKDGVEVAKCTAAAGAGALLTCVYTPALEAMGSTQGDFWVEMSAAAATDLDQLTATANGAPTTIPLPGGGGIEGVEVTDPNLTDLSKFGSQYGDKLVWTIQIPSGVAGSSLHIEDALANVTPYEWHQFDDSEEPRLFARPTLSAGGDWVPGSQWEPLPVTAFTLAPTADHTGFSFSMDSEPDMAYQLTYFTKPTGLVFPGDSFSNEAVVNGKRLSSNDVEYRATGGGGAEGVAFGRFDVTKTVLDNAGRVAPGTAFTVRYTVGDEFTDLIVPLDGEAVQSPRLKPGTVVTIAETDLPVIEGVTWGEPRFTIDGVETTEFTVVANQTLHLALENSIVAETPVDPDPVDPVDPVDPDPVDPVDPVDPNPVDPVDPVDPGPVGPGPENPGPENPGPENPGPEKPVVETPAAEKPGTTKPDTVETERPAAQPTAPTLAVTGGSALAPWGASALGLIVLGAGLLAVRHRLSR